MPVPIWLGGAGTWLGGRRASTLAAFLAIFTMGPLVLLSALSVNSFYAAVTTASNLRLSAASALAAVYVDTEMTALATLDTADARRPALISALRDGNHNNYDNAAILTTLKDLRTLRSDNRFAAIIDPLGTFWGNEDPPAQALIGQNYGTAHDWFQGASKAAKAYVSPAYVAASAGAPLVVAISAPVMGDGTYAPVGAIVGILLVGYGLTATQTLFSDFARNQGMLIEVTDQKGVVVAHSGSAPTGLLRDNSAGVNAALKGNSSVGRVNIAGEDVFAAYTPVSGVGWTLVARVPAAAALADATRLQTYVIGLTIVLLVLLGAAKVILYMVLRDRQATHVALARANSGLSERVTARTAELEGRTAELETSNNQLVGRTAQLVSRSAELETSNNQLVGRTAELETSNNQLVGRTAELVGRSAELETSNNQLVGRTAQLVSRSAELEASNNQLVGRTAELVGRTAELETSNQQLAGRTAELVGRTAELEGRTAELEASNRELEAFGYSVSHDLRSPLRSIDGFSRLVLEENKSELSAEGVRRLGLIRAGAQQMGILIEDLLSFSRLGRVELKKRRVFTADIVNEVIAELKQENPDRQIEFVMHALPACLADPVLLKQVFRNVLGNSVKFSRTRPGARIEVGSDEGTDTATAGMVMFFIKDNGVGFDMRYIDKLFGVFQRLHRMEDFPGTGVGLALIRRIVERHGGKVWAEGVVDSGATFYLTLEDGNARA
ncbi:MAG TPA: ATP-binding protein [Candidatus Dormibacteraeota bacterium]|nr:ATP-binding protein [Candidatus Dormibacteraeota bacterium]